MNTHWLYSRAPRAGLSNNEFVPITATKKVFDIETKAESLGVVTLA